MTTESSAVLDHSEAATPPITIRATTGSDSNAVNALLASSALPTEGVADFLATGYAVAEQTGRLIGVAGIETYEQDGLLRSVAVDAALRGRGLGVALVQDRLHWARARGLRDLYLLTTTAPDFFARLGFTRIERAEAPAHMQSAPEFAVLCAATAITMRLSLSAG